MKDFKINKADLETRRNAIDCKVTYNGFLVMPDTDKLYVHMGYQDKSGNWKDIQNVQMFKNSQDIYEAIVPIADKASASFAFYNGQGVWDNNNGKNYKLSILDRPNW